LARLEKQPEEHIKPEIDAGNSVTPSAIRRRGFVGLLNRAGSAGEAQNASARYALWWSGQELRVALG
jgi:hypothetical protein